MTDGTAAADERGVRMRVPSPGELAQVIGIVAGWTRRDAPVQLHPGDIGWHERRGAAETAAALRVFDLGGTPVAVGLTDGDVLRIARDPAHETESATRLADALAAQATVGGARIVELPNGSAVRAQLSARDWHEGELWTPLRLDLASAELDAASGTRIRAIDRPATPRSRARRPARGVPGAPRPRREPRRGRDPRRERLGGGRLRGVRVRAARPAHRPGSAEDPRLGSLAWRPCRTPTCGPSA